MKHIWVVQGATGEYSDHTEWIVCGYLDEDSAKKHSILAQARADELRREYSHGWHIPANANEYDSGMQSDYTGTTYSYHMIEVRDKLP